MNDVLVRLRALAGRSRDPGATDSELLGDYVDRHDESAFEELLHRHGPTVLGVCQRILGRGPDAEDAFQATFFVLARKSGSICPRSAVAGWLYGVAVRASQKVRAAEARRRTKEGEAANMPRPVEEETFGSEASAALHRELARLPNDLRAAIVLCDLEGKTRATAARQLGWAEGTVASRLARGRRELSRRLKAAGVGLLVPLGVTVVPSRLFAQTLSAAAKYAAGARSVAAASAVAAAEEVITDMLFSKLTKTTAMVLAALAAVAIGLGTQSEPTAAAPIPKEAAGNLADVLKTARPINVPLLEQDEVLAELKCTRDQRETIAGLIKAGQDEYKAAVDAELRKAAAAGGAVARFTVPSSPKYDTVKLAAALTPEQLIRLRQLELHLVGPRAFADRRVVRALGLSADEEARAEEIIVRYEAEALPQIDSVATGGKEVDAKPLAELGEKWTAECVKLLSKDQRDRWKWLTGERPAPGQWARAAIPPPRPIREAIAVPAGGGPLRLPGPPK